MDEEPGPKRLQRLLAAHVSYHVTVKACRTSAVLTEKSTSHIRTAPLGDTNPERRHHRVSGTRPLNHQGYCTVKLFNVRQSLKKKKMVPESVAPLDSARGNCWLPRIRYTYTARGVFFFGTTRQGFNAG
jgi:hypothetical protein